MKKDIHPEFHTDVQVTCACGATHTISSVKSDMKVEICSQCHPFYTGNEKSLDTAGRVDKFKKRMEAAAAKAPKKKAKPAVAQDKAAPAPADEPKEEVKDPNPSDVQEEKVEETPAEARVEEPKTEEATEDKKEE